MKTARLFSTTDVFQPGGMTGMADAHESHDFVADEMLKCFIFIPKK